MPLTVVQAKLAHTPEAILALLDWTLRAVIAEFGSVRDLVDVLTSTKLIATIDAQRLKTAQARGEFIERDHVRVHIFGAFAETNRKLLADLPRTVAIRGRGLWEAGQTDAEIEEMVYKMLEKQLTASKVRAEKAFAAGSKKAVASAKDDAA